ncbi:caprin-2 isoform X2 [Salminus brasiliensis]|uniref:caprin-2 isoform X2 n=1 Tax=Salminus brasiliensis TaxID=930266 RepID=UPI003B83A023
MSDLQSVRLETPRSRPEERMRETRTMVLLSPSPSQALGALGSPELLEERDVEQDGSLASDSPQAFTALQLALNPSASIYHGYDTYIEEGLICLRHKIRNIEKKKLKLEGYKLRLKEGEMLNQDQMDAVGRYEEVVHNLKFARDLQTTLCALTQDLLKAQKKAVRHEQTLKAEMEQRRLSMVLQVQYVLRSLQRDDVRRSFCNAREHAKFLSTQEVEKLLDLALLLGCKRDAGISLEDQMEQASFVYLDLLEGKDKPVAGATYKLFKEKLLRLVDCGFFDHIPAPPKHTSGCTDNLKPDASSPCSLPALVRLNANEVPSQKFLNRRYLPEADLPGHSQEEEEDVPPPNWKAEFLALKEREPPDSWDMEFSDAPASSQSVLQKPWKGAAGFIPKTPVTVKRPAADPKQKRQRKNKGSQGSKCDGDVVPVEVFNSPSSLAKDPTLRRQQLDHLMDQITGSFSFIQDSLLDGESSPTDGRSRRLRLSPGSSPLAQREQKKTPADLLPQTQHSTPLHVRLVSGDDKGHLANGGQTLDSSNLSLCTGDTPNAKPEKDFTSPPLYRRESTISLPLEDKNSKPTGKLCNGEMPTPVSAQTFTTPPSRRSLTMANASPFDNMHSVFSGEAPVTVTSELKSESGFSGSMCLSYSTASTLSYTTASTQTPPEFSLPQDDLQMESAYLSESEISATSQVFSSPGPSSAPQPQSSISQPYYSRSTLRGTARGGRGLPHSYRSPGTSRGGYEVLRVNMRTPGGGYITQTHRDPGSLLYNSRENGYHLSHKRPGGTAAQRNSSAGWSDSSQVSSPDRDGAYLLDSGHGDSLSISPMEVPMASQGAHTLLPVHVYPVSQQLRVAFSAARTANFAPGTLDQPIAFDLLHSNLGEVFDAPSGRFSCPAAGTYVFIFHILKLAVNVPLYINLMRNEEVMVSAYANDGAPDHETASNHAVLQLYHGDQVWLRLHRGAIYGSSWKYSTFSGFLLYQD